MKCPKCHYLSFDPEPRCRNCGYTLALDDAELALKPEPFADVPMADLALRDARPAGAADLPSIDHELHERQTDDAPAPKRRRRVARGPFDATETEANEPAPPIDVPAASAIDAPAMAAVEPAVEPQPAAPPRIVRAPAPALAPATAELPLFVKAMTSSDVAPAGPVAPLVEPAIVVAAAPRPGMPSIATAVAPAPVPLVSVRAAAEPRKLGPLDHDLLEDLERIETNERREAGHASRTDRVGALSRLGAAVCDTLLLGGLAAGVVWMTLRWCELPWQSVRVLPLAPTASFLAIVGLGYLMLFTVAGGQTVGKMLFRIRVVGDDTPYATGGALSLRQAIYREVVALPSILALVGFLPALVGEERALHDRIAQTRVVRA